MTEFVREIIQPLKSVKMSYVPYVIALLFNSMMFPVIQMLLSFTQKYLVNSIEFHNLMYMNYVYVLASIVLMLVLFVNPLSGFIKERAIRKFMFDLRMKVLWHVGALPLSYFDRSHSGDVLSRFDNDLRNVSEIYTDSLFHLFLAVFYGLGAMVTMFFLCWQLAFVIIMMGVFETWMITKFSKKIRENSNYIQEKYGLSNERFLDIVQCLRSIRMLSISHVIFRKYENENEDIRRESMTRSKGILLMNGVADLFTAVNLVGLLSLGVILYFYKYIDLGSVMAFLILQDGVSYMFSNIVAFFPEVQEALACSHRVFELLDESEESAIYGEVENLHAKDFSAKGASIFCKNLYFSYPSEQTNRKAIDQLSCVIESGKITAFAGPSGGGKTSLVKLLLGLYKPDEGSIFFGNTDYKQLSLSQIRENISYVSQFPFLFSDTIAENIRCGNSSATDEEVIAAAKDAYAHEFIMERSEGYQTVLLEQGADLSGGQRQRIALARALLKNAPVIILDEATTGLDSVSEMYVYKYIESMVEKGVTVLLIAHRLSSLKKADTIYIIEEGTVKKQVERIDLLEDKLLDLVD